MFRPNMVIIRMVTKKDIYIYIHTQNCTGIESSLPYSYYYIKNIYITKVDSLVMKRVKIVNILYKHLIFYKYFKILYFLYTSLVKELKPYTSAIFTKFIPKAILLSYVYVYILCNNLCKALKSQSQCYCVYMP